VLPFVLVALCASVLLAGAAQLRANLVNTAVSYDALRNLIYGPIPEAMVGPGNCVTADSTRRPLAEPRARVESDRHVHCRDGRDPLGTNVNAGVGLSNGAQTAYAGLACIVRFNNLGRIDARNGSSYAALSQISYSPNTSYHFRFVVNVQAHTYSVYVRPAGSSE